MDIESNEEEDIELIGLEIKKLKSKKFKFGKSNKIKNQITLNRKFRHLKNIQKNLAETTRELLTFVKIADTIKMNCWRNDKLTVDKKRFLEENMWIEKAKFMMAVDLMTIGNLSKPIVEMIYSMPTKNRKELISMLTEDGRKKLISLVMK